MKLSAGKERTLANRMNRLFDVYIKWGWHALQDELVMDLSIMGWEESEKLTHYQMAMLIVDEFVKRDPELKYHFYLVGPSKCG